MIRLELRAYELAAAWDVAGRREVSAILRASRPAYGLEDQEGLRGPGIHFLGACAELAVARSLGLYWPGSVDAAKREADIPPDVQVRATPHRRGCLIVHPNDVPDHRYVLAIVDLPEVRIIGWMWGRDAQRPEWWTDRNGNGRHAWFVPQDHLQPMPGGRHG